jgi:tripartite ATP-independent transporter DctP family solute receptor
MLNPSRRSFALSCLGAAASLTILKSPLRAAPATYKLASNLVSTHPIVVRIQEATDAIRKDTAGEVDIRIFASSSLGGDLEVLSQLRAGAIQFYPLAGAQISNFVPVASLNGVGFAFKSTEDALKAVDGEVGSLIRNALADGGLHVFDKMFDSGFRQITSGSKPIASPGDLKALPIRVPPSPLSTSLFKSLGAAPQSINFGEVYTALQTKLVDAQENPLILVDSNKFYEVQKYVSMTNHMWDGFWILGNKPFWDRLPTEIRDVIQKHFNAAIAAERADIAKLNESIVGKLKQAGMTFVEPDQQAFRAALAATSFYRDWKEKFGDKAWAALEQYSGKLG